MPRRLVEGLYEHLLTEELREAASEAERRGLVVERSDLSLTESNVVLARHLASELLRALDGPIEERIALCNRLLAQLGVQDPVGNALLLAVRGPERLSRPSTAMSVSDLLTGSEDEPRLGVELEREIATADRVDLLVSFVTWHGFRRLQPALEALARRGKPLRLITTTYTGATDAEAVEAFSKLPNVEVKISYDGRRTRLHAKAWLFHRASGLSTAYVGSANLSKAALAGGLEWTVKLTERDLPHVLKKFEGTFGTLWEDAEFEPYRTGDPDCLARLRASLQEQRGAPAGALTPVPLHFTLRPFPFQEEILDRLAAERLLHGRHRNLVVAATGTGKTLIAAFDYARRAKDVRPRLLFVAHRAQLLQQSIGTFRAVLRDGSFGELLAEGAQPASFDHLFTTVQSFKSRALAEKFPADHWETVIVDECHHSTAETYSELVERMQPKELIGLTATPERADGESILPFFGGRAAAEIRLWHALERQLLAPFEYYGLSDETDLSEVAWRRGGYDEAALEQLYTGNDRRAELALEQFRRLRGDVRRARAIGFCVSVAHAEFMARKFTALGVPALAVHGNTRADLRLTAPQKLERREVNVLFTCDLYNEGVDLPFVDTLLLLRPTTSATVFLQQLGRGLRIHDDKLSCLVLDFIGQQRREFRFDRLLTAMTGVPRGKLERAVEQGFPTLPSGCHVQLDKVAANVIVQNLRQTLGGGLQRLKRELTEVAALRGRDVRFADFLEDTGRPVDDVYAAASFTTLKREAGLLPTAAPSDEAELGRRFGLLTHVDDPERIAMLARIAAGAVDVEEERTRRLLLMLGYQLWHAPQDKFGPEEIVRRLNAHPALREELSELASVLENQVALAPVTELPADWPLQLHRTYGRREIQAAVGFWNAERKGPSVAGVLRVSEQDELFFVTLVKEEKHYSPTTRYRDYAVSPSLFHWQSQAAASAETERRYTEQATNGHRFHLFVRKEKDDAFTFLGPLRYVSHEGSRPISITWRLETPMSAALFQRFGTLASS